VGAMLEAQPAKSSYNDCWETSCLDLWMDGNRTSFFRWRMAAWNNLITWNLGPGLHSRSGGTTPSNRCHKGRCRTIWGEFR